MHKPLLLLLLLVLFVFPQPQARAAQPDLAREQRLASEIVDAILDGEPVWLEADGRRFLAIWTEAYGRPRGSVVILHGRGYHPDWPDVVQPLRVGLAERGWNTLSLQMPVLHKQATYYDYLPIMPAAFPRIEAGIRYAREQGGGPVVLVAHSCGAHMAMEWIRERGDDLIDAYVGIGMGATDYRQKMPKPFPLDRMRVPVLDVYGADEYPAVLKMAPERLAMMRRAGNPLSRQVVVPDADHYFRDRGEPLLEVVAEWLDRLDADPRWPAPKPVSP